MPSLAAFLALVSGQIIKDLTIRLARAMRAAQRERGVWAQPRGLSSPAVGERAGRKTQPWDGCSQQRKLNPKARFNTTHSTMPAGLAKMCTHHTLSLGRLRSAYCISEKLKKIFFPPSTNRFLEALAYFGPRAALCAKLKP